jgi:hypothetical protein
VNDNDALWRSRFFALTAARLLGLATFIGGVFIAMTDVLRPGGWPLLGGILAIVGAIDSLLAPRVLKKFWEQQDTGR